MRIEVVILKEFCLYGNIPMGGWRWFEHNDMARGVFIIFGGIAFVQYQPGNGYLYHGNRPYAVLIQEYLNSLTYTYHKRSVVGCSDYVLSR